MKAKLSWAVLALMVASCGSFNNRTQQNASNVPTPIASGGRAVLATGEKFAEAPPPTVDWSKVIPNTTPEYDDVLNPSAAAEQHDDNTPMLSAAERKEQLERDTALYIKKGFLKSATDRYKVKGANYKVAIACGSNPNESEWEYGTYINDIPYTSSHAVYWGSGYQSGMSISPNTLMYCPTGKGDRYGGIEA